MVQTAIRPAGAATRYRQVDVGSRVEGATPHELVVVLFDELLKAIDQMLHAIGADDTARRLQKQARAVSILHGLETALDFERGGEIAANLSLIYREARRLLAVAPDQREAGARQARAMIADIAGAWASIAP